MLYGDGPTVTWCQFEFRKYIVIVVELANKSGPVVRIKVLKYLLTRQWSECTTSTLERAEENSVAVPNTP